MLSHPLQAATVLTRVEADAESPFDLWVWSGRLTPRGHSVEDYEQQPSRLRRHRTAPAGDGPGGRRRVGRRGARVSRSDARLRRANKIERRADGRPHLTARPA